MTDSRQCAARSSFSYCLTHCEWAIKGSSLNRGRNGEKMRGSVREKRECGNLSKPFSELIPQECTMENGLGKQMNSEKHLILICKFSEKSMYLAFFWVVFGFWLFWNCRFNELFQLNSTKQLKQ